MRGVLESDAYIGQSHLVIRPIESVISAQAAAILDDTANFKDLKVLQMIEEAYIMIENGLSEKMSKVIETAAINTPLRNLLNFQEICWERRTSYRFK